jgi:hypothetical protein
MDPPHLFPSPLDPQSHGTGSSTDPCESLEAGRSQLVRDSSTDAAMITAPPLPLTLERADSASMIECGYRNSSDRMVILRCLGPDAFFLERVVFPFELLSFACPMESEVEILTHGLGGPELMEAMPCSALRLDGAVVHEEGTHPLADPLTLNPWLQAS